MMNENYNNAIGSRKAEEIYNKIYEEGKAIIENNREKIIDEWKRNQAVYKSLGDMEIPFLAVGLSILAIIFSMISLFVKILDFGHRFVVEVSLFNIFVGIIIIIFLLLFLAYRFYMNSLSYKVKAAAYEALIAKYGRFATSHGEENEKCFNVTVKEISHCKNE